MKIALDARALCEEQKTGIGQTIEKMVENLELLPMNQYQLNYFAFRKRKQKKLIMKKYENLGYQLRCCCIMPFGVYSRLWRWIPIPYSWLMGKTADITQFFNYVIPPGVKGVAGVYIYDMVYKACPETMEIATRQYMERHMEMSCKRADFIITISEFSKNEIVKYMGVSPQKIYVVPCGVDLDKYRSDISSEDVAHVMRKYGIEDNYFLYLGTLEPRKNIPFLLKAYCKLYKELGEKTPYLVLAGNKAWGYHEILELIKKNHIEKMVIFTGYIDEVDKPALLRGAICFLFPSLYEGFGIPPLEAMACGTPVIVSNRSSLPEVVGKAGILIDPEDVEDMMGKMKKMLTDAKYRHFWGALGEQRAEEFSWKAAAEKLNYVYCTLREQHVGWDS